MRVFEQIAALVTVNEGLFDDLPLKEITEVQRKIIQSVAKQLPDICERVERGEKFNDEDIKSVLKVSREVLGK